jgi:hypothetical protein
MLLLVVAGAGSCFCLLTNAMWDTMAPMNTPGIGCGCQVAAMLAASTVGWLIC